MFVAGIDAHATYSVLAIVSNAGQLVHGPTRIKNKEAERLDELLKQFRSLEGGGRRDESGLATRMVTSSEPRDHVQGAAEHFRWCRSEGVYCGSARSSSRAGSRPLAAKPILSISCVKRSSLRIGSQ